MRCADTPRRTACAGSVFITASTSSLKPLGNDRKTPSEGGEAARVTHGNNGVLVESAVPESVRAALIQRGHKVTSNANPGGGFGGYQGIMFDRRTGVLMGGSDVRKDGLAIGF